MNQTSFVYYPSPMYAAKDTSLVRQAPRPTELRQVDYIDKFDYTTIFYDVFQTNESIVFSGPPLRNNQEVFNRASVHSPTGEKLESKFGHVDRTQSSTAVSKDSIPYVKIKFGPNESIVPVGGDLTHLLKGRNVLLTKSKDNDIAWIYDWTKFYVANHGIDSVVIYDNGSVSYGPEELQAELKSISGLKNIIIVSWPFKFGPQGGNWGGVANAPWDSDYCEYGILQHARHRFLKDAAYVAHFDIDELLVMNGGRSVIDVLREYDLPGVSMSGRWIDSVTDGESEKFSFRDYKYHDRRSKVTTKKWVIRPSEVAQSKQWKTHYIQDVALAEIPGLAHRHFVGITSNWKYKRVQGHKSVTAHHELDKDLVVAIGKSDEISDVAWPNSNNRECIELLCDSLSNELSSLLAAEDSFIRSWIYKNKCVVVELKIYSGLYGVDIVPNLTGVDISIVGRNSKADGALRNMIASGYGIESVHEGRLRLETSFPRLSLSGLAAELEKCLLRQIALISSLDVMSPVDKDSLGDDRVNVYWWAGKPNFGDVLGPLIVESITGKKPFNIKGKLEFRDGLVTVGSLLNHLDRPGLEVWGSGLIRPIGESEIAKMKTKIPSRIHAVRGALTRHELVTKLGLEVPEVYGDPALLLPKFFRPDKNVSPNAGLPVAVLHYQHSALWTEDMEAVASFVDVADSAETVVSQIALASHVVSSSLHGVIVAEAYGVPWTWLRFNDNPLYGDRFKFDDFFTVIEKDAVSEISIAKNELSPAVIKRAIEIASLPKLNFDSESLLASFPMN